MDLTIISGNLGKDAELFSANNGRTNISFSVAVNKKVKDQTITKWYRCSYWRPNDKLGIHPYLKKGTRVICRGEVDASAWNSQEGGAQATLELNCFEVELTGAAEGGTSSRPQNTQQAAPRPQATFPGDNNRNEENLPF